MCGDCDKLLCDLCLNNHVDTSVNLNCPHCNKHPFEAMYIPRPIRNFFNLIEFYCPHECGKKIKYDELRNHLISCEKYEKIFNCILCNQIIRGKSRYDEVIIDHVEKCIKKKKRCKYCGNEFNPKEADEHQNVCNQKPITCEKCSLGYLKQFECAHNEFYCLLIFDVMDCLGNLIGK
jgi:hypothetical protein